MEHVFSESFGSRNRAKDSSVAGETAPRNHYWVPPNEVIQAELTNPDKSPQFTLPMGGRISEEYLGKDHYTVRSRFGQLVRQDLFGLMDTLVESLSSALMDMQYYASF